MRRDSEDRILSGAPAGGSMLGLKLAGVVQYHDLS